MFKKVITLLLVVVMLLAFHSVAFAADEEAEQGFEISPVFVETEWGSWMNVNNELLRFDVETGRTAIPGMAYENANLEDSVIYDHNGQSLVDPLDTWD